MPERRRSSANSPSDRRSTASQACSIVTGRPAGSRLPGDFLTNPAAHLATPDESKRPSPNGRGPLTCCDVGSRGTGKTCVGPVAAMLADGTGPGKHEAGPVEGPESQAGYLPLQLFGLAQAVAASSGNRLSHRLRTRADKISSGHNSRRSERLRIATWSATMPSEMVAW